MSKFGQEIDKQSLFFSSWTIQSLDSGSDNRYIKNIASGFKIATKNSCPQPIFSWSETVTTPIPTPWFLDEFLPHYSGYAFQRNNSALVPGTAPMTPSIFLDTV